MNNIHLNYLTAILILANVSTSSLINAKSKKQVRKKIAVNAVYLSNQIAVTKNNLVAVLQEERNKNNTADLAKTEYDRLVLSKKRPSPLKLMPKEIDTKNPDVDVLNITSFIDDATWFSFGLTLRWLL
ncbi:MAG TPA: hypothetical protein ENI08_02600 [Candidatus Dependentiae bacterium]|nr:hypothetical protein [Candidatus Dependentiae bacterium]